MYITSTGTCLLDIKVFPLAFLLFLSVSSVFSCLHSLDIDSEAAGLSSLELVKVFFQAISHLASGPTTASIPFHHPTHGFSILGLATFSFSYLNSPELDLLYVLTAGLSTPL